MGRGASKCFPGGASGKEPASEDRRSKIVSWEDLLLSLEDPLEESMSAHSRILAWRIPWTEEISQAIVHSFPQSQTRLKWLSTQAGCFLCWDCFSLASLVTSKLKEIYFEWSNSFPKYILKYIFIKNLLNSPVHQNERA